MKRILALTFALSLFAHGAGRAEMDMLVGSRARIMPGMGAVYLLDAPSPSAARLVEVGADAELTVLKELDENYTCVNYRGQKGYVSSTALDYVVSIGGLSVMSLLTAAQRENLNRFLTDFSESSLAYLTENAFYLDVAPEALLVEFAVDHIWFHAQERMEFGEYENGDNVRFADSLVPPVVKRYFGVELSSLDPIWKNHAGGYYSWEETGGYTRGGFAILTNVMENGSGNYELYFNIYGESGGWSDEAYSYTPDEAARAFPDSAGRTGRATIHAESLDDPGTFTLSSFVVSSD